VTQLGTSRLAPGGSAELLEAAQRLADRVSRRLLLPRAPADDPESKQRAGMSEAVTHLLVAFCGLLEE
jgi:hypothetical protein